MGKHEPCLLLTLDQSTKTDGCANCTPGQQRICTLCHVDISRPVEYNKDNKGKEMIAMTTNEFVEKLNEWTDHYGWGDESLNDFANTHATSYEEYNAIWEILNELKIGA